eukprot:4899080-Prymnesium_polylepis.1
MRRWMACFIRSTPSALAGSPYLRSTGAWALSATGPIARCTLAERCAAKISALKFGVAYSSSSSLSRDTHCSVVRSPSRVEVGWGAAT